MILKKQIDQAVIKTMGEMDFIVTVLGHSMCGPVATQKVFDLILNQTIMLEQLSRRLELLQEATKQNDEFGIQMILNTEIPLENFT